jgi:deoxycytidylate deaminase
MSGPCAKQTVTATIVAVDGNAFVATNSVRNPQPSCPRAGMASGQGYELCRNVCDQEGHAEINALRKAGESAAGATLYLEGHYYVCDDCHVALAAAGVTEVVFGSAP